MQYNGIHAMPSIDNTNNNKLEYMLCQERASRYVYASTIAQYMNDIFAFWDA